jgi:chaperonin cofactor prefoldin
MGEDDLVDELRARVKELENKVEALRIGRRVLMSLIETIEKEKKQHMNQLASQNERLQKNNSRYARSIMHQHTRITELEEQISSLLAAKNKTGNSFT